MNIKKLREAFEKTSHPDWWKKDGSGWVPAGDMSENQDFIALAYEMMPVLLELADRNSGELTK